MFKKSRRKIVLALMSVFVLLWTGTLGVIYVSSYFEMYEQNRQMLKTHADHYMLSPQANEKLPADRPVPDSVPPPAENSPVFQLSTFYTVALKEDGQILEVKNDRPAVHTDRELETLAGEILESGKTEGTESNLMFYVADKKGYMLVSFMDNTIFNESVTTLFRYTFLFGFLALLLFFFLSRFLARKIVEPLEESYRRQKQFISDAGHELKTPISVIGANAELLAREEGETQWLSNIRYENERMTLLVSQLLELAHAENTVPQMEKIDFSRLAEGEALPFESVAFEKGLVLECSVPEGIAVEGNGTQLKQLVSILIDNAIRHSFSGNKVWMKLIRERGFAKLSVINAGEEIPIEERERIFERFYRMDEVRNGDDKHYGLGLAIAKAIVQAHKGRLKVVCDQGLIEFRAEIPECKK